MAESLEEWEHEGFELFSNQRAEVGLEEAPAELTEKTLERVKTSMVASDVVELGTVVLVAEFLGPVLDLFAYALGFDGTASDDGSMKNGER